MRDDVGKCALHRGRIDLRQRFDLVGACRGDFYRGARQHAVRRTTFWGEGRGLEENADKPFAILTVQYEGILSSVTLSASRAAEMNLISAGGVLSRPRCMNV